MSRKAVYILTNSDPVDEKTDIFSTPYYKNTSDLFDLISKSLNKPPMCLCQNSNPYTCITVDYESCSNCQPQNEDECFQNNDTNIKENIAETFVKDVPSSQLPYWTRFSKIHLDRSYFKVVEGIGLSMCWPKNINDIDSYWKFTRPIGSYGSNYERNIVLRSNISDRSSIQSSVMPDTSLDDNADVSDGNIAVRPFNKERGQSAALRTMKNTVTSVSESESETEATIVYDSRTDKTKFSPNTKLKESNSSVRHNLEYKIVQGTSVNIDQGTLVNVDRGFETVVETQMNSTSLLNRENINAVIDSNNDLRDSFENLNMDSHISQFIKKIRKQSNKFATEQMQFICLCDSDESVCDIDSNPNSDKGEKISKNFSSEANKHSTHLKERHLFMPLKSCEETDTFDGDQNSNTLNTYTFNKQNVKLPTLISPESKVKESSLNEQLAKVRRSSTSEDNLAEELFINLENDISDKSPSKNSYSDSSKYNFEKVCGDYISSKTLDSDIAHDNTKMFSSEDFCTVSPNRTSLNSLFSQTNQETNNVVNDNSCQTPSVVTEAKCTVDFRFVSCVNKESNKNTEISKVSPKHSNFNSMNCGNSSLDTVTNSEKLDILNSTKETSKAELPTAKKTCGSNVDAKLVILAKNMNPTNQTEKEFPSNQSINSDIQNKNNVSSPSSVKPTNQTENGAAIANIFQEDSNDKGTEKIKEFSGTINKRPNTTDCPILDELKPSPNCRVLSSCENQGKDKHQKDEIHSNHSNDNRNIKSCNQDAAICKDKYRDIPDEDKSEAEHCDKGEDHNEHTFAGGHDKDINHKEEIRDNHGSYKGDDKIGDYGKEKHCFDHVKNNKDIRDNHGKSNKDNDIHYNCKNCEDKLHSNHAKDNNKDTIRDNPEEYSSNEKIRITHDKHRLEDGVSGNNSDHNYRLGYHGTNASSKRKETTEFQDKRIPCGELLDQTTLDDNEPKMSTSTLRRCTEPLSKTKKQLKKCGHSEESEVLSENLISKISNLGNLSNKTVTSLNPVQECITVALKNRDILLENKHKYEIPFNDSYNDKDRIFGNYFSKHGKNNTEDGNCHNHDRDNKGEASIGLGEGKSNVEIRDNPKNNYKNEIRGNHNKDNVRVNYGRDNGGNEVCGKDDAYGRKKHIYGNHGATATSKGIEIPAGKDSVSVIDKRTRDESLKLPENVKLKKPKLLVHVGSLTKTGKHSKHHSQFKTQSFTSNIHLNIESSSSKTSAGFNEVRECRVVLRKEDILSESVVGNFIGQIDRSVKADFEDGSQLQNHCRISRSQALLKCNKASSDKADLKKAKKIRVLNDKKMRVSKRKALSIEEKSTQTKNLNEMSKARKSCTDLLNRNEVTATLCHQHTSAKKDSHVRNHDTLGESNEHSGLEPKSIVSSYKRSEKIPNNDQAKLCLAVASARNKTSGIRKQINIKEIIPNSSVEHCNIHDKLTSQNTKTLDVLSAVSVSLSTKSSEKKRSPYKKETSLSKEIMNKANIPKENCKLFKGIPVDKSKALTDYAKRNRLIFTSKKMKRTGAEKISSFGKIKMDSLQDCNIPNHTSQNKQLGVFNNYRTLSVNLNKRKTQAITNEGKKKKNFKYRFIYLKKRKMQTDTKETKVEKELEYKIITSKINDNFKIVNIEHLFHLQKNRALCSSTDPSCDVNDRKADDDNLESSISKEIGKQFNNPKGDCKLTYASVQNSTALTVSTDTLTDLSVSSNKSKRQMDIENAGLSEEYNLKTCNFKVKSRSSSNSYSQYSNITNISTDPSLYVGSTKESLTNKQENNTNKEILNKLGYPKEDISLSKQSSIQKSNKEIENKPDDSKEDNNLSKQSSIQKNKEIKKKLYDSMADSNLPKHSSLQKSNKKIGNKPNDSKEHCNPSRPSSLQTNNKEIENVADSKADSNLSKQQKTYKETDDKSDDFKEDGNLSKPSSLQKNNNKIENKPDDSKADSNLSKHSSVQKSTKEIENKPDDSKEDSNLAKPSSQQKNNKKTENKPDDSKADSNLFMPSSLQKKNKTIENKLYDSKADSNLSKHSSLLKSKKEITNKPDDSKEDSNLSNPSSIQNSNKEMGNNKLDDSKADSNLSKYASLPKSKKEIKNKPDDSKEDSNLFKQSSVQISNVPVVSVHPNLYSVTPSKRKTPSAEEESNTSKKRKLNCNTVETNLIEKSRNSLEDYNLSDANFSNRKMPVNKQTTKLTDKIRNKSNNSKRGSSLSDNAPLLNVEGSDVSGNSKYISKVANKSGRLSDNEKNTELKKIKNKRDKFIAERSPFKEHMPQNEASGASADPELLPVSLSKNNRPAKREECITKEETAGNKNNPEVLSFDGDKWLSKCEALSDSSDSVIPNSCNKRSKPAEIKEANSVEDSTDKSKKCKKESMFDSSLSYKGTKFINSTDPKALSVNSSKRKGIALSKERPGSVFRRGETNPDVQAIREVELSCLEEEETVNKNEIDDIEFAVSTATKFLKFLGRENVQKIKVCEEFRDLCIKHNVANVEEGGSYEALDGNIRKLASCILQRKHKLKSSACNMRIDLTLKEYLETLQKLDALITENSYM